MYELPTDSRDYHLITKGIELSKNAEGLCCEIGVRRGGGIKYIIDAVSYFSPLKTVLGIDPYGNIPYEHKEGDFVRLDYTEDMKAKAMSNIYGYSGLKKIPFIFKNMTDEEFFKYFKDGVPVHNQESKVINKYSFVHFDGPHAIQPLIDEIDFFKTRVEPGACFVFDDIGEDGDVYYDHAVIENYLFENGFKLIEKTVKKALYQYED